MYSTSNLPTFTWAGALKPQADADKTMRNVLLAIAAVVLLAALAI